MESLAYGEANERRASGPYGTNRQAPVIVTWAFDSLREGGQVMDSVARPVGREKLTENNGVGYAPCVCISDTGNVE